MKKTIFISIYGLAAVSILVVGWYFIKPSIEHTTQSSSPSLRDDSSKPRKQPPTNPNNDTPSDTQSQTTDETGPGETYGSTVQKVRRYIASLTSAISNPTPAETVPDSGSQPILPEGRYRNLVFDTVSSTKDITYESSFETEIVSDIDGYKTLAFNQSSPLDLKLNIYRPTSDPMAKRPLIIFVYGGGWIIGDRFQQEAAAIHFAKLGYVTATIDYTMLPPDNVDNPVMNPDNSPALDVYATLYSESARDIYGAYEYLAANKDTYGIDIEQVGLAGWSAGGQISSALTHYEPLPTIPGLQAVLGASSILSADLLTFDEFTGYKTFNTDYSPVSMFASYDDDTGYAGTPNDHTADCTILDNLGHTCIGVTYPGSGHDVEFHLDPVKDDATNFFATYLAGV